MKATQLALLVRSKNPSNNNNNIQKHVFLAKRVLLPTKHYLQKTGILNV